MQKLLKYNMPLKVRPFMSIRKFGAWVLHILLICMLWPATATADQRQNFANGHGLAPLEMFQECAVCPEMIVLPMGSFIMGAPLEKSAYIWLLWKKPEPGVQPGIPAEGPEHEVIIDIPIAMGRNEVTYAEFMACVDDGGCSHTPNQGVQTLHRIIYADDPRSPVIDVSYLDMLEYVAWLNRITGTDAYRLPTEAEWEYAAYGGADTKFGQGDSLTTEQANFTVFHRQGDMLVADLNRYLMPVPVDMLDAANAWGLRHMAGNVLEITMSCWSDRHLGLPTSNAYLTGAQQADSCKRVVKGGSYGSDVEYARPANRGRGEEANRSPSVGFRIVREM